MSKRKRKITVADTNIAKFIASEMSRLDLNKSEYAEKVGVSHTTIGRILAGSSPTTDVLAKIAIATGYDVRTLISVIHPEATSTDPQRQILADQINALPPDLKDQAMIFVLGLFAKRLEKNREDS